MISAVASEGASCPRHSEIAGNQSSEIAQYVARQLTIESQNEPKSQNDCIRKTTQLGVSSHPCQLGCARHGRKPAFADGYIGLPELLPIRRNWAGVQMNYLESVRDVMQARARVKAFGK